MRPIFVGLKDLHPFDNNKKDYKTFRMILEWNKKLKHWMRLATNISRAEASPEEILQAYHIRWQIELFFKELKSYSNLKKIQTGSEYIAKGLILMSLSQLFLKDSWLVLVKYFHK